MPNIKKHLGPPLEREVECENFLTKYANNKTVISGPYIEDGRWVVMVPRKTTDVAVLLKEKLSDGGKNAGVAEMVAESISKKVKIIVNSEIGEVYAENVDFAVFLTDFVFGKPFWI